MSRRTEIGLWAGLVVVAALAGLAIAGMPQLGAGPDPAHVATPSTVTDTAGEDSISDGTVDDGAVTTSTPSDSTSAPTSAPSTSTTTTTTTAIPQARPATEVSVLVLNGTRVNGAAGRLTETLAGQGHPTLTPTSTRAYDASEVWFTGNYGPEAAELAQRLGVFPENVRVMPDDAGVTVGSANVIVVVGPDLAEDL